MWDCVCTQDVCGLIRRFDRDGDGNLNFPEFCTFIKLHVSGVCDTCDSHASCTLPPQALPATSGDGVRSSPVEPTVQTAKPRVVRGVTVSSTKAQEAACARKGFEAVRVDGLAEVLLWLDVDTSNPTPLPVDAIVSICVLPSDASR